MPAAAAIHDLGGGIEVASQPGRGTVFTLSLPLTLAIVRSLIVEVDRERYAVPLSHVAETVRLEPGVLHEINRQGVLMWRGAPSTSRMGAGCWEPARAARRPGTISSCCSPGRVGEESWWIAWSDIRTSW